MLISCTKTDNNQEGYDNSLILQALELLHERAD